MNNIYTLVAMLFDTALGATVGRLWTALTGPLMGTAGARFTQFLVVVLVFIVILRSTGCTGSGVVAVTRTTAACFRPHVHFTYQTHNT